MIVGKSGKKNSKDLRMKVYTRKIIILVHTYRKNCTHKNLVCILDYGWWGVFTEFCSDSTAVCLYLVDESKTTTTNPDETSFLLIFYICSRLLKEFFWYGGIGTSHTRPMFILPLYLPFSLQKSQRLPLELVWHLLRVFLSSQFLLFLLLPWFPRKKWNKT